MSGKSEGALSGYRILDTTDSRGAYCTKLLADMGADVIKVESPQGDPFRQIPPFVDDIPHNERSLYFLYRNCNKRGITLNLETSDGKAIFRKLVKNTDVLVDNSQPGHMERLGLEYKALREISQGLVMASITEFGRTGPYSSYKGSNLVDLALSTVMIGSGFSGQEPCTVPGTPAYDGASLVAAIGIIAALYLRGMTGKGHYFDTSVHENSRLALYSYAVSGYSYSINEGGPASARESRHVAAMYPVYRCKDGLVRIIALAPRQWDALVRVLGSPEVLLIPEWRDFLYRIGNADDLRPIIEEFTVKYTMNELFEAGHDEGVPIAPVYNVQNFIDSEQTKARGFFIDVDHPVAGQAKYPGPPYKWTETPTEVKIPAPCLGQHNEEIYCGELGISIAEFSALRRASVI